MDSSTTMHEIPGHRRHTRRAIELMAHLRHDLTNFTVLLKDLSICGARVEGVAGLSADQPVALSLPGRRPALAFVAWANEHCAGLEFADPLPKDWFEALLASHGPAVMRPAPGGAPPFPMGCAA